VARTGPFAQLRTVILAQNRYDPQFAASFALQRMAAKFALAGC
jgi:hypothetical protein